MADIDKFEFRYGREGPFGPLGGSPYANRRRANSVIISPSMCTLPAPIIVSLLTTYEELYLACPREVFLPLFDQISSLPGIKRRHLTRIYQLDEPRNPFDHVETFTALLDANKHEQEKWMINFASQILTGTNVGDLASRHLPMEIAALDPNYGPYVHLPFIWWPMAMRTLYILRAADHQNSVYVTQDSYELALHDTTYWAGQGPFSGVYASAGPKLQPSIDHRSYFFRLVSKLVPSLADTRFDRSEIVPPPTKGLSCAIGVELERIADKLYKPPYYISEQDLRKTIDSEIIELASRSIPSRSGILLDALGTAPMPSLLPNPIALLRLFQEIARRKRVQKKSGWLLYLSNIARAAPYFTLLQTPLVPEIRVIRFRDDVIHTVAGVHVLNRKTKVLHESRCPHLASMPSDSAMVIGSCRNALFDGWSFAPDFDSFCKHCCYLRPPRPLWHLDFPGFNELISALAGPNWFPEHMSDEDMYGTTT